MNSNASRIEAILFELRQLIEETRRSQNIERFMFDVERWKERAAAVVDEVGTPGDARRFRRMSVRPSWVNMETPDAPILSHLAFLEGLRDDLARQSEQRSIERTSEPFRLGYDLRSEPDSQASSPSLNSLLAAEAKRRGYVWLVLGTLVALFLSWLALY